MCVLLNKTLEDTLLIVIKTSAEKEFLVYDKEGFKAVVEDAAALYFPEWCTNLNDFLAATTKISQMPAASNMTTLVSALLQSCKNTRPICLKIVGFNTYSV